MNPPADDPPDPARRHPQPRATLSIRVAEQGKLEVGYLGVGPQNEDGTDFPVGLLVGTLNRLGARWGKPEVPPGPEGGVDFVATGPDGRLQIQVTRVPANADRWKTLRRESIVRDLIGPEEVEAAAADLAEAIRRKGAKLAPSVRAASVLALDATYSYAHAMAETIDVFDAKYAGECQAIGFGEVWVVGVMRLDRLLPGPLYPSDAAP